MISTYAKSALRNLLRHKGYSLLNIAGLAIGMACCILILAYVRDELSFDRYNRKGDRIFRVSTEINFGGRHFQLAVAPAPMAATLAREFPEVESATRFRRRGSFLVKRENGQNSKEERLVFADNELFKIFTIPLLSGDPQNVLTAPGTLVLSKSTSEKYFGDENPVGLTLVLDNRDSYQVTGVFEDIPLNSHFHFDIIASLATLDESRNTVWGSNNFQTYVLLREGGSAAELETKFPALLRKYLGPQVQQLFGISYDELLAKGNRVAYQLQPLLDIHLASDLEVEFEPNGSMSSVYLFSAIAFFILLIACINFMNLATARSATRAKEVGIRKVVGSSRSQLMIQFIVESLFLSLISMIVSLGVVELLLPSFNALSGRDISVNILESGWFFLLLAGITLFVGFLAGSYPAFVLSAFNPLNAFKGRLKSGSSSLRLRSFLVVFQFTASVVLIAATLIIHSQLQFIQQKKLGFDKEQVIILHDAYALGRNLQSFKNEVLANPSIVDGTVSGFLPVRSGRSDSIFWPDGESPEHSVSMQIWSIDYGYVKTMGLELVRGRDFSMLFPTDSMAVILNEQAAKQFGFNDPVGKKIATYESSPQTGEPDPTRPLRYTVVGVVRNFHFESMRERIGAWGMRLGTSRGMVSFRFMSSDVNGIVGFLREKWETFGKGQPFAYSFLDERFASMYSSEQRIGDIFNAFSLLAIFTACLGLYGLAAFTAEQRTKEIGIRKVLGASLAGIVSMLSKEFLWLVGIAFVFAVPISFFTTSRWLENFAYRVDIGWSVYAFAGGLALLIALVTVSFQALRAAFTNPVDTLRHE